jgi:transposase
MNNRTVIAADIAKNSFQCVNFINGKQVTKNRAFNRSRFEKLITRAKPMKLVMETCSGAQHWGRLAKSHGHDVVLIAPKFVSGFRQGQKTDANDAVAIFEASRSVNLKESIHSSVETQALGMLDSVRTHYQTRKTRLGNALRGHLAEFGIVIPKGVASVRRRLPLILEDADNGLPDTARFALNEYWLDWQRATEKVLKLDRRIKQTLSSIACAKELCKLEGIGPVCTTQLLVTLGDGKAFKRSKEASAFVGVSPKQYSTGGKVTMTGIGKHTGHKKLKANLIQGARSVIQKVNSREPVSELDHWLVALIERVGENRAAVALANKNVRRAWAIIAHNRRFIAR